MNRDTAPRGLSWLIGPVLTALGAAILLAGPERVKAPAPVIAKPVPVALATRAPAVPAEGTSPAFRAQLISTTPRASVPSTRAIEDVRVGDRVLAGNPEFEEDAAESEVDPSTWMRLVLEMRKDGSSIDIVLLRPREWVEAAGAAEGNSIPLRMPEMGAVGPARVLSVGPCPRLKPGKGRVVTGTFTHDGARVIDVRFGTEASLIGVTLNHPIYSLDRKAFVDAGDLWVGESLQSLTGPTRVSSIEPREGLSRVYNLEVNAEHAYRVSESGILVHNSCGALGELEVEQQLDDAGYSILGKIQNKSNQGIDLVTRDPNGVLTFVEIKATVGTSAPGLSAAQKNMSNFVISRLNRAISGRGLWAASNVESSASGLAQQLLDEIAGGAAFKGIIAKVKLATTNPSVSLLPW